MPLPPFVKEFPQGDDDSYPATTRLPRRGHQFLADIQAEYQFPNRSQALRFIVQFAHDWLSKIAEQEGELLSPRMKARLDFNRAEREATERKRIIGDLHERQAEINQTDHTPTRSRLVVTAERLATAYQIPWPPPDMALVEYDSEAKYILDRILVLLQKQRVSRINLRDLIANSIGDKAKIMPVLGRLEAKKYVVLTQEQRSGPPTTWIKIPSDPLFSRTGERDEVKCEVQSNRDDVQGAQI